MMRILSLGLLCSVVGICIGSGAEEEVVSSIGDVRESGVLSSLLPDSQGSTYLLAFPVDDANNSDQPERVQAAGAEVPEVATEKPASVDEDEEKDEVMTVLVSTESSKEGGKNEVIIPVQDLQPKEGPKKFFPPPVPTYPFKDKPMYPPRMFPLPLPFDRFRPKFLPPVRNLLQSFRREQPSSKTSPIDFLSAASLLRRALSNRLRVLSDRYQPTMQEEKVIPLPPLFVPPVEPSPLLPLPSPMSLFVPSPAPEPTFMPPFSPFHPMAFMEPPPFLHPPPLPFHPSLLLPPFIHPFLIPPPSLIPPPPPTLFYHSFQPNPMLHPLLPMPFPHPPPSHFPPILPPFLHRMPPPSPPRMPMPQPTFTLMPEPSPMMQSLLPAPKESEDDEIVILPSDEQFTNPDEPTYLLLYPNESEPPQNEMHVPSAKASFMDLLRPPSSKVRHVIQQTRIITRYKPSLMHLLNNQLDLPPYHKPIFRIVDN